jgi:hypothetical protein
VERLPRKQQAAGAKPARGFSRFLCSCVVRRGILWGLREGLLNVATPICSRLSSMRLFHSQGSSDKLQCPYKGCEKHFDRPTMITDDSVIPRQTHYACPYCMSRLELDTAKEKIVGIRATEYPTVFDSPAKCAHFSGLLNAPSGSTDECLICPKVLQCNVRKK